MVEGEYLTPPKLSFDFYTHAVACTHTNEPVSQKKKNQLDQWVEQPVFHWISSQPLGFCYYQNNFKKNKNKMYI